MPNTVPEESNESPIPCSGQARKNHLYPMSVLPFIAGIASAACQSEKARMLNCQSRDIKDFFASGHRSLPGGGVHASRSGLPPLAIAAGMEMLFSVLFCSMQKRLSRALLLFNHC